MLNLLIIEDETPALNRIIKLVKELDMKIQIIGTADSIEAAVKLIETHPSIDLALMDIELADGQSFEIFKQCKVSFPVIFTTAYDEYAMRAFKVNSIDYLLKPVDSLELKAAFEKYNSLFLKKETGEQQIENLLKALKINSNDAYKERFLVKTGSRLISVQVDEIAWFQASDKLVYLQMFSGNKYVIDYSLDELIGLLNPKVFFQLNRQFISSLQAIKDIHTYFNGKLKITLLPSVEDEVLVSRERAAEFKNWLDA
ncbi:MAG: LytR/AlgR family response regulator transcription factor [Bacteroidia bacterium]